MQLDELRKPIEISQFKKDVAGYKNVDTRDDSWKRNLNKYMLVHGFTKIGSGKYASVYGNSKYPFVIKVFMKDAAYQRWLKFSLENKSNVYVPKIKGKVIKITPLIYAIRLEKLEPIRNRNVFFEEFRKWESDNDYVPDDKDLASVFAYFKQNKKLIDIHNENVMIRPNGQLVIVDPFYNWRIVDENRFTIDPDEKIEGLF